MLTGALIIESLRIGTVLEDISLIIRKLSRSPMPDVSQDQPEVWTVVEFVADHHDADVLAEKLSHVLGSPGWYASFETNEDDQVYVVFPGRVFRYARHNDAQHKEALTYARAAGVPEDQCDW